MQNSLQGRYQNGFPQRQVAANKVLYTSSSRRTVPSQACVNNSHTVPSYGNSSQTVSAMSMSNLYHATTPSSSSSAHQGNELCLPPTSAEMNIHELYQNQSTTTTHNQQGYFSQYSQPASQPRQEQLYFQRSQQMAVSMNQHPRAEQSQMFSAHQQQQRLYTSSSLQETAVTNPMGSNILPSIEEQYQSTNGYQQAVYSNCVTGLQPHQFPTFQGQIPWEENDNHPEVYMNHGVDHTNFQRISVAPQL